MPLVCTFYLSVDETLNQLDLVSHQQIKAIRKTEEVFAIENNRLLRYSMQLSMLKQLLNKKLITDSEYEVIKKKLMRDYGVVSDITT